MNDPLFPIGQITMGYKQDTLMDCGYFIIDNYGELSCIPPHPNPYDRVKKMNSIEVLLRRNKEKDHEKDNITYFGFDIHHGDGTPANVNFAHFCKIGIATIFGKDAVLQDKDYKAIFHIVFVNEGDDYKEIPNTKKARRLYMIKSDNKVQLFFRTGIPLLMNFDSTDEDRVLKWINFKNLPEDKKIWFDFGATLEK